MKKLLLLFCGLFLFVLSYAQEPESKVKYVYTLEEALQQAKKENKLIFFNCYADWVVSCHAMDKQVFSDPAFSDYLNKNFVNLFMDVAKSENSSIAEKYNIKFFSHYLVLDSNGEVVHRVVGGAKLPIFQENIALALNPKTSLQGMEARYEKGENSVKFYRDYLNVLSLADYNEKYSKIVDLFLAKLNKKDWAKAENWSVIRKKLREKDNEYFDYLLANKEAFVKNNGAEKINQQISSVYVQDVMNYALGKNEYNATALADLTVKLNKADLPENDITYRLVRFAKFRGEKQYDKMLTYLQNDLKNEEAQMIDIINLSFDKIRDAKPTEKKLLIDYLNSFLPTKSGGTLREYNRVIGQIIEFTGIEFFEGPFKDALALAKKENKLIFFDGYTSWCGPCKQMAGAVFSRKDVGDLFNKTFVNVKMDMEKGEGIALAEKYGISSYPTMILVDGDGNLVHKIIGSRNPSDFIQDIMRGTIKESSYCYLVNNLETVRKNPELYMNYLTVRKGTLEITEAEMVKEMTDYLSKVKNVADMATPVILKAVNDNITDYRNPVVVKIVNNSELFKTKAGADVYTKSMERIFFPVLLQYFKKEVGKDVFTEVKGMVAKMKLPTSTLSYAVAIADAKDNDQILNYYEKVVASIANPQDKLNVDLILRHLVKSMTAAQQEKVKGYVAKALENADPKAKNGYKSLAESI